MLNALYVANNVVYTIADNHYYEAMTVCGGVTAWATLKVVRKLYRMAFRSIPEREMTDRLRRLTREFDTKTSELNLKNTEIASREKLLKSSDQQINGIKAKITEASNQLTAEKNKIKVERDKWIAERDRWDAEQGPCDACGSIKTSLFCGQCGARQKSQEVAYVDQPFSQVNDYLHTIARWGRPMDSNGGIVLPWPTKEGITFAVGDVEYTWSKEDSEDYDGEWYATLEWEHPILGSMKLINKVQGDNAHVAILTDTETEYEMTSGSIEEIERSDVALAVEQALTAMACWMQSKRINP